MLRRKFSCLIYSADLTGMCFFSRFGTGWLFRRFPVSPFVPFCRYLFLFRYGTAPVLAGMLFYSFVGTGCFSCHCPIPKVMSQGCYLACLFNAASLTGMFLASYCGTGGRCYLLPCPKVMSQCRYFCTVFYCTAPLTVGGLTSFVGAGGCPVYGGIVPVMSQCCYVFVFRMVTPLTATLLTSCCGTGGCCGLLPCSKIMPQCRNDLTVVYRITSGTVYGLTSCFRTGRCLIYGGTAFPIVS